MLVTIWCIAAFPACCALARYDTERARLVFHRGDDDWGAFDPKSVKLMVSAGGRNPSLQAVDLMVRSDAVVLIYRYDAKARAATGEPLGFGDAYRKVILTP